MTEPTPQPEPSPAPRRRRYPRPNGKWTNPATPLQAARFERRITGKTLVMAIRKLCPGHAGEPCKLDVSKASDYETGNRRPGLEHIEAFARFYQRSPEDLGLIKWRDEPTDQELSGDTEPTPPSTLEPSQPTLDASVVPVATIVVQVFTDCPVTIITGPNEQETETTPEDGSEDDPPAAASVPH